MPWKKYFSESMPTNYILLFCIERNNEVVAGIVEVGIMEKQREKSESEAHQKWKGSRRTKFF